jgi:predicted nucleotidyltransferase
VKLNDEYIKRLAEKLYSRFPQIAFAYLFGSAVTGELSGQSDIDVAIFLKPPDRSPEMIAAIIGAIEETNPGHPCDLLILNDAGKLIAMEALKGKILFIRQPSVDDHAEFYSITCRMFEDIQAWMKKQLKYRGYEVQWDH